jgi:hypothetical protein
VDRTAYDEVCGVHGVAGVGATSVGFAFGVEGQVVCLVFVFFVLGAVGLVVFEGGVFFDLVGEGWEGEGEDGDSKDRGCNRFSHG